MRRNIFLVSLIFLFLSCKSKEEKLKEKLLPLIIDVVKTDSLAYKIDSVIIFKIDTLTDLDIEIRKMEGVKQKVELYQSLIKSSLSIAELYQSQARSSASSMKLYRDILNSPALAESESDSTKDYLKKAKEEVEKSKRYSDTSHIYLNQLNDFFKRRNAHKIDSINFRGYISRFHLRGADQNNVQIKIDSLYIYFSDNLRLINPD